jgi:TatD DNase family protein
MELIDTHCHIQFKNYRNREDEILFSAAQSKVKKIICVGTSLDDSAKAADLAASRPNVWASAGIHPHQAAKLTTDTFAFKKLKEIARRNKVVAIGETGLDYYKMHSDKKQQEAALRAQIEIGLELKLPFIFHVREAWQDFWRIFDSYYINQPIEGVIHSFSSYAKELDDILSRGLYVGLNGIMTFTKDKRQLDAAKAIPLDRLVFETDAPFLTPAPFRGQLCEPKHVLTVAEFISKLQGIPLKDLAAATTANALKLFRIVN